MTLQKFVPKSGVNKEDTRLYAEGGWYDADKVRFVQGVPEVIGGWERISASSFMGVCRKLFSWATLAGTVLNAVGTHLKAYIAAGGGYNDITPARLYTTYSGPFAATPASSTLTVTAAAHGASTGDFVTFYGALALSTQAFTVTIASPAVVTLTSTMANNTPVTLLTTGALPTGLSAGPTYYIVGVSGVTCNLANVPDGVPIITTGVQSGTHTLSVTTGATAAVLNTSFTVTVLNANSFTVDLGTPAGTYDTGTGGTSVGAAYDIPVGNEIAVQLSGWGAGTWGSGPWGVGADGATSLRIWNFANFGQDLLLGTRGGVLYYYNANFGLTAQAIGITIASPAVVTWPVALPNGTAVVFLTSGALPTGLVQGTVYYVVGTSGLTSNVAATFGGAAINTSGTQSGTQYLSVRAIPISALAGASDTPLAANFFLVSDASRFVMAFGVNPIGALGLDPMFVRWTAQESAVNWTPAADNQAGGVPLSRGSKIVTAQQVRQEILIWTDAALYTLQYVGPPYVWATQLMGDNLSIIGPNAVAVASGITYWMGVDKFYKYDGRVQTMRCDLRRHIFGDINRDQVDQFFAGTNEGFNEVWFFYCSAGSTTVDRYVIYNYFDDSWANGTMARTAWVDSGLNTHPLAAAYENTLVFHELGLNDNVTGTPAAINAHVESSEFDIGDGDVFGFVWRLLPDITFGNSTSANPTATFTLNTLSSSGSGYRSPASVGGAATRDVVRSASYPVERYTGQINVRVRGRQMSMRVSSNQVGTTWQLGATRIDVRVDGQKT